MPYFIFRYYRSPEDPSLVEGVTCAFFEGSAALREPLLLVSQVRYGPRHCGQSDVLDLFPASESQSRVGETIRVEPDADAHILSARSIPVRLYSVLSREAVGHLIERVRREAPANGCVP